MRVVSILFTGIILIVSGIVGPVAFGNPRLSTVTAESVRVRSIVRNTRSGGGGFFFVGSGRGGSSRYSSGGGFSSGK
jgi:hypothetical protein